MKSYKWIFIALFAFISYTSGAQDWKTRFGTADCVYTSMVCEVDIVEQDGKLVAVRNFSEDLVYQTDNAVKMMSRGYIYHSSFNTLKKWDAYTRLPNEKKKIRVSNETTQSSREDYIFYDDAKSTTFDFTGATIGATRHLEYQLLNKDIWLLSPFYFERYFPVAHSVLRISFPSDVQLKYIPKGQYAGQIRFSEQKKKDRTIYEFTIENIEGSRSYPDAPDGAWYSTHLIFYVEKVKKDGEWKNFLASPDDLYRHYYQFISDINKTMSPELKNLTDSIVKDANSPREKAGKIYKWVQSHIKYVAFEEGMEGFIPRDANLVCSRRFGDCKDMTSILTSMLRHAGVEAYFTWIGTRDIPYDYTEVHLPIADNHMICAIKLDNEYIFLDGTDESCIYGMPPYHLQGKQALIAINEKEYRIERVPVMPMDKNVFVDSTFVELTENGIRGNVKIRMTGYIAASMYQATLSRNQKELEEYCKQRFRRGSNKISFSNWKIHPNGDHSEILITVDFELPDYAKKLAGEWYMNLNLFKWYEHQEIDYPKRKMPVEVIYKDRIIAVTVLKIPEGYQASYIPQSGSYKNETWGFSMNYSTTPGYVYLTQQYDSDQLMIYPNQFEKWNKVLENLYPHYKQSVSLSKIK